MAPMLPAPSPALTSDGQAAVWLDADVAAALRNRLAAAARALTGDRELADDLVQDTSAAVLARPRRVRRGDELGYLRTALRNRFRDHLRASARRPRARDEHALETLADVRVSARPEAVVEHRTVLAAVDELPQPYREAIVAVDIVGLSYEQAAAALGVPVGTIMSRLYRGRTRVARTVG
jgi:RNA polymerase sigma-70 factor, ECF subfamily